MSALLKGSLGHDKRTPGLPSRCIDWTNSDTLSLRFYSTFDDDNDSFPPGFVFEHGPDCVVCPSASIGKIKMILDRPCEPGAASSHENFQIVSSWASKLQEEGLETNNELDSETNQEFFRRFFRTVFRDTAKSIGPNRDLQCKRFTDTEWDDIKCWWEATANASSDYEEDQRATVKSDLVRRYCLDFFLGVSNSTLAVTDNNQLCMVPQTAQQGDAIFHIYACSAPLILRPVIEPPLKIIDFPHSLDDSSEASATPSAPFEVFEIVGPCYLQGYMGSEGYEKLSPRRIVLI